MQGAHAEGPKPEDLRRILRVAEKQARRLGANGYEVDEIAQLTVIRLAAKWNSFHVKRARALSDARFDAYIRRTATNIFKDEVKKYWRRLGRQGRALGHTAPRLSQTGEIVSGKSLNMVEAALARSVIAEEIMRLPPLQREVAVRLCIQEKSIGEVAKELGLQPQSVHKRMRIAREMLRKRLAELERQSS